MYEWLLGKFDGAIHLLTEILEVCKKCFDKSMALSNRRFSEARKILLFYNEGMDCYNQIVSLKKEIDRVSCSLTLVKASSSWVNEIVLQSLEIPTNSPCYSESLGLANRIANSLDEMNRKEWEFQYEKYKDEVSLDYYGTES